MARAAPADILLPAPVDGWPVIARIGAENWPAAEVENALERVRSEYLWWPASKSTARKVASVTPNLTDFAEIDPTGVDHIKADTATALHRFGVLGGKAEGDAAALLAASRWTCPWTGAKLSLAEGVEA